MTREPWDLQWCRPKIQRYIITQGRPNAIYVDWLEAWLQQRCRVPQMVKTHRLRSCISQCLRDEGYHHTSKSGKRWELLKPTETIGEMMNDEEQKISQGGE